MVCKASATHLDQTGTMLRGNEASSVSEAEDNEEVELESKGDIGEDRVVTKAMAVSHPVVEDSGSVGLCSRHDAMSGHFHCSEEFRAKSISVLSWDIRQGLVCGYSESNSVSNSLLVRSCQHERVSAIWLTSPLM